MIEHLLCYKRALKPLHLFILCALSMTAFAQKHGAKVTGVVKSDSSGVLSGVSVVARNMQTGAPFVSITKSDGTFSFPSLSANATYVFTFSQVGYKSHKTGTYTLKAGSTVTINVSLKIAASALNEVMVVAFGTKKKQTLIESITQVDSKIIIGRPVNNAISALQGQVAGVNIVSNSGQPGAVPSINIRGVGSINSSTTPLYVIDGIPGSISSIDPNDIETISVLKDASAASLYGARAANGVILVATKKGKVGEVEINYSGYVGWQKPTELFKEANAYNYANAFNEATQYDLITPSNTNFDPSGLIFTPAQLNGWKSGAVSSTNWRKALFSGGNGFTQSHYINIRGGGVSHDNLILRNSLSFGYLEQNGNVVNTSYKRYSIRSNNGLQWKHLSANLSIGLVNDNLNEPSSKTSASAVNSFKDIISAINRQRPVDSIKRADGSWNITATNDTRNPVRQAAEGGYSNSVNYNILVNFNTAYAIAKNLTLKYTLGLSYNINSTNQFQNQLSWYNGTVTGPNQSLKSTYNDRENMQQIDLSYSKNIKKHHVDFIVGGQQNIHNGESTSLTRGNFINNSSNSMQLGDPSTAGNGSGQFKWILEGWFARFNYDYDKTYIVEFNLRQDASSRLNPSSNTDFFSSFAAGWRISNERFWKGLKHLFPEMKLKASYGTLGNANVATSTQDWNAQYYSYNSIIGNVTASGLGTNGLYLASVFDGSIHSAFTLIQNPNNKLKWERTTITDIALDGNILNSNFTYTFNYFNKETNQILLQQPLSDVNGVTSTVGVGSSAQYPSNLGSLRNRGIEISMGYSNQHQDGFSYSLNANYTYASNKILDLGGLDLRQSNALAVGYPLSSFYLYVDDGLLSKEEFVSQKSKDPILTGQKWGDQRIKDISGDNKITAADKMMINKSGVPKNFFGLNFDFNYKGVGLSGLLQGATDFYQYLGSSVGYGFSSGYSITNWTINNSYNPLVDPNNYNTRLPRVSVSNSINDTYPSTKFLFNSSYVRLKNLQVYYNFSASLLKKMHMKSLRIFASGQNLFTLSRLPKALGIDPEVTSATSGYPLVVIYTVGINASF